MRLTNSFKTNNAQYITMSHVVYKRITGLHDESTLYYWLLDSIFLVPMIYDGSNVFHTGFESIMEGPRHAIKELL